MPLTRIEPSSGLLFFQGNEAFLRTGTGKGFHRLLFPGNVIIMARPGYPREEIPKTLPVDVAEDFYYNFPGKKTLTHGCPYPIAARGE